MERCNFFTKHDDRLGYHFNPDEKYYEFKPTIRDKLHALVAQYMASKHNCANDKEPTSNGLRYIPQNVKKQMLKEMRSTTTDSLLVYDIKLPSHCASDAQQELMKSFVDLKDNSAQFPKDRPPPHLNIMFNELKLPLDDLQKCQFAIELRKELMSPSSTLRVVVRLPTRGQKRHAHNIKLLEELLQWSTSFYCAQTISQVKFMSEDDTIKLYATYLGSCDNCIADGTVCAMKESFNNDNGNTGDNGRIIDSVGAGRGANGGADDDTSMSGCESTVGKTASDMDTDVDDDDDDGNDDIAVDTDEDDDDTGLVIDDRKCGGGVGGVPMGQLGGGRDLDLGGVAVEAQLRFGEDGENNAAKSLISPSSSSSLENNAPSLVRFDAITPGVGEGATADDTAIVEGVRDCANPTIKQLSVANKRYPKAMVNSCTFSDKPPLSYRNTLEYARIVAVDVHSDGTTHTHYAHYGQNTERIYDIIKEKGKLSKPRRQVKRKRKVVPSDGEHAWKKLKIVTCDTTATDTPTMV